MPKTGQTLILNPWIRRSNLSECCVIIVFVRVNMLTLSGPVDMFGNHKKKRERERKRNECIDWDFCFTLHHSHPHPHTHDCSQMRNIECVSAYEFVLQIISYDHVHRYIPNQIDWFSLSQCSSSGLIRMSSVANNGFSSGNVSSRRWSGSVNCHVNNITKSTDSNPDTSVYSFQGSTFFYRVVVFTNQSNRRHKWSKLKAEREGRNKNQWNIHECILGWKQKMLSRQHQVIQT